MDNYLEKVPYGKLIFVGLLMLAGILGLGFFVEQKDFVEIIIFYNLAFLGYLLVLFDRSDALSLKQAQVLGVLLRLILVFAMPG